MLDEREDHVPAHQLDQAFNRKPVLQRMAIVAAGPLANLLLAFALLWAMLVIGRPDYAPVVGKAAGIAAEAGLRSGDRILAVGERETPTWSEAGMALTVAVLDRTAGGAAGAARRWRRIARARWRWTGYPRRSTNCARSKRPGWSPGTS